MCKQGGGGAPGSGPGLGGGGGKQRHSSGGSNHGEFNRWKSFVRAELPMKDSTSRYLILTHYLAESCCPMAALYNICPVTSLHQKVQSGSLIEHRLLSVCLHGIGDTNDTGTNAASQEAGPCPFIKSTRYLIISRDSEFCSLSIILHLNLMSICSSVLAAADQEVCR